MTIIPDKSANKLVVPDVSGMTQKKAAHAYLDAGFVPAPWMIKEVRGKRTKVLARSGTIAEQVAKTTHASIDRWRRDWQCGMFVSPETGVLAGDIDDPAEFTAWEFEEFPQDATARSGRPGGRHILMDGRTLAPDEWPTQGNIPGGQIKSNGFIAVEPSIHPNGNPYLWRGKPCIVPSINGLGAALAEYRRGPRATGRVGTRDSVGPAEDRLWQAVLDAQDTEQHEAIKDWVWDAQMRGLTDGEIVRLLVAADLPQYDANHPYTAQDFSDLIAKGGRRPPPNGRADEMDGGIRPARAKDSTLLANVRTGDWLTQQKFARLQFAVPGLLPAGVVVIAGAPFAGKGLLVLRFVLECARGGKVFGQPCEQRDSFYLALEDSDRRMQDRAYSLLGGEPIPSRFSYITHAEPGKLPATVDAWLSKHPKGIVVVDTLGKVLEKPAKGETTYDRDYRIMGKLTELAVRYPGCVIIINTHTRKAKADDFVDMVSGTNAIAGAADTVLVLARKRGSPEGTLMVTSRDLDEAEYALSLERPGGWQLVGEDLLAAAGEATRRHTKLEDRSQSVVAMVNGAPDGVTPSQVAETVGISAAQARVYLSRLSDGGHISWMRRGVYGPYSKIKVGKE